MRMKASISLFVVILIYSCVQVYAHAGEKAECAICRMKVASITVGMKEPDALKALGKPASKGGYHYNGECTADYSATWSWTSKGLDVVFTAEDAQGKNAHISKIIIAGSSSIKLKDGIGIGSAEKEVAKVFGRYQTEDTKEVSARTPHTFWIGQSCEAIRFDFKKGKVSRISIGTTYCDC